MKLGINRKEIKMPKFLMMLLFAVSFAMQSHCAVQLTLQQRKVADTIVAKRIAAIQAEIVKDANLQANIVELAQHKKEWQAWVPAMRIGFCVKRCKDSHVPVPQSINEKVIDDIIWQYDNAYGTTSNDLNYHRQECARALGFIGHPKAVPTIIESLEREGGHFSWQALEGISDERFIPAIEKHLDFSNQQDAFPAIISLGKSGEKAIPVLQRFLKGNDRPLRGGAVEALIEIERPSSMMVLKDYLNTDDTLLLRKIQSGVLRIQCRAVDKIYTPPVLSPADEARLWHLTYLALLDEQPKVRSSAADALVKIGVVAVSTLQPRLSDYTHYDYFTRPAEFFVSERAANILKRIGTPTIPSLIDALCDEQQHARNHAAEVLRQLTGQKFGSDYVEWSRWFLNRPNRPTPAGQGAAPDRLQP